MSPSHFEPVSPIDLTAANSSKRNTRTVGFSDLDLDEKSDFRSNVRAFPSRTNSTASSIAPSVNHSVRKARFAEATSVFSPADGPGEHLSPFADPKMADHETGNAKAAPKPSDVGFGYISDNQPVEQHATVRGDLNPGGAPLKSALKTPGTAARLLNPLSPTFREEVMLEKQEESTDKEQAKDLVSLLPLPHIFCKWKPAILTSQFFSHRKSKPVFVWPRWFSEVSTSVVH